MFIFELPSFHSTIKRTHTRIYILYNIIISVRCERQFSPIGFARHLFFCPRAENQEGGTRKIRQIYTFIETIHNLQWGLDSLSIDHCQMGGCFQSKFGPGGETGRDVIPGRNRDNKFEYFI